MGRATSGPSATVALVAGMQHGAISRPQLLAAGLSPDELRGRIDHHTLHRVFRGVYLAGHADRGPLTLPVAALLAAGDDAALSLHTSGHLRGLRHQPDGIVDVTHAGHRASRPGLRMHRGTLAPGDVELLHGLPVTTPRRTIADLARVLPRGEILNLIDDALISGQATWDDLKDLPATRDLIDPQPDPGRARSRNERRLIRLIREAGLDIPLLNAVVVNRHRLDAAWPQQRVAVEYDSWRYHHSPERFARDRARHNALQLAGWILIRLTYADLFRTPARTIATIAQALAQTWPSTAPGTPVLVE